MFLEVTYSILIIGEILKFQYHTCIMQNPPRDIHSMYSIGISSFPVLNVGGSVGWKLVHVATPALLP